jgi:hypothetical protein
MITLDSMFRISSNPFFPYLLSRIDDAIAEPARAGSAQTGVARRENRESNVLSEKSDSEFDDMARNALNLEQDPETIP